MSDRPPQRIVAAALKYEDGTVVVGARHFDSFMQSQISWFSDQLQYMVPEQGFIDNRQEFLNRVDALEVAEKAKQIWVKLAPKQQLTSEDIY